MDEQVAAVRRMQDYIEANLSRDITMGQLSKVSLFSPWYSYRIFREYVGITPSDYIRKLRLVISAQKLRADGCRVTDAAFDTGFQSVDGYQRAFFKEFGCNPGEYSRGNMRLSVFIPYGAKFRYQRRDGIIMDNVQSVFIQIIHKEKRKVIIKRGISADSYFPYCEEVGCDVWETLAKIDSLCGEPVCLWLPQKYIVENTSVYVQGVEVSEDYSGQIPEGFDEITLPTADYLMFQGEPFEEKDYCEAIQAVQESMNRYDPALIGYTADPDNPRIQLEPRGERGYIELLPVKKA